MSVEVPSNAPQPRLCHVVKWPDFDGYGFNLHAEKAKSGQFIGKVDDDSPAYYAGLKEGDRIIEVNGVNIANENHRQVVERIKAVPNETKLLVLDGDADKWYKERKMVVKNSFPNVKSIKTPVPRPSGINKVDQNAKSEVNNNVSAHSNGTASPQHSETHSLADSSRSSTPKTEPKRDSPRSSPAGSPRPPASPVSKAKAKQLQKGNASPKGNRSANGGPKLQNGRSSATPPSPGKMVHSKKPESGEASPKNVKAAASSALATANGGDKAPQDTPNGAQAPAAPGKTGGTGELNLNMSAAEMREMLANKKKNDPKKQSMDMREKYQIVQQM